MSKTLRKKAKQFMAAAGVGTLVLSAMGCQSPSVEANAAVEETQETQVQEMKEQTATATETEEKVPKYVFLFIGDGMSYPQIQMTNYFLSANAAKENPEMVSVEGEEKQALSSKNNLTMLNFPVSGSAQTYDSTSYPV